MAKITKDGNRTIFELETAEGYQTFRQGTMEGNKRQFTRNEETAELGRFMNSSGEQNVVVKFGDVYTKVR